MKRSLLSIFVALLGIGCSSEAPSDIDPVVDVAADDPEMLAAQQQARDTVDEFIAALKDPAPGQEGFSVKVAFEDGDQNEYMWLSDLELTRGKFVGTVNNVPQVVKNVELGDRRSVAPTEINDWLYLENGNLVGAYTAKALSQRR